MQSQDSIISPVPVVLSDRVRIKDLMPQRLDVPFGTNNLAGYRDSSRRSYLDLTTPMMIFR